MEIIMKKGDFFQSPPGSALVIPVNTVGVAGAGLAQQAAHKFPGWQAAYRAACERGDLTQAGDMVVHYGRGEHVFISFATKRHWRDRSDLAGIRRGAETLARLVNYPPNLLRWNHVLAVPALGCGLGGLDWKDVKPVLLNALSKVESDIQVWLFEPGGKS